MQMLGDYEVVEIISWLPVKSLLRFQSVCKAWCALIRNPRFIALHHNRAKTNALLIRSVIPNLNQKLQQYEKVPQSSSDMMGVVFTGKLQVFGPCNGIVCLNDTSRIVLCNPAIREFKVVPPLPFSYPRGLTSTTTALGFGFDPYACDYKVVRISSLYQDDDGYDLYISKRVEVYNLSTDSWRHVDISVPLSVYHYPNFEMFFNGAFHFYGRCNRDNSDLILAFDISKEVFRPIQFSDVCKNPVDTRYRSLTVFNDSLLALILYNPSQVEKYFDIWVMNEYGVKESWTHLFSIGPLVGIDWPLALWKDDELLMENSCGFLVSYNLATGQIHEFPFQGFPKSLRVLYYKESLISINNGN